MPLSVARSKAYDIKVSMLRHKDFLNSFLEASLCYDCP